MALQILYFARIRETIGSHGETVSPPVSVETITDLVDWLTTRGASYAEAFADRARLRAAIDQAFAHPDASIVGAREISFFPPVTGG